MFTFLSDLVALYDAALLSWCTDLEHCMHGSETCMVVAGSNPIPRQLLMFPYQYCLLASYLTF